MNDQPTNGAPLPSATPSPGQLSVAPYDFGKLDSQRGAIVLVQLPGMVESGIYIPLKSLGEVIKALEAVRVQLSSGIVIAGAMPAGKKP